jgi:glutaredoxin
VPILKRIVDRLAAEARDRLLGPPPAQAAPTPAPTSAPAPAPTVPGRESAEEVLRRVKTKAEHGLKPEDRLVVIYATAAEAEDVAAIRECFANIETQLRESDLAREPQTQRQLAKLTDVMVPPYVYINGRYWGARYDIETLAASNELEKVVANRLDELGPEARRIGKLRDSFSDEISVDNVLERWRLGHILCVDDLDSWFEVDKDGRERFFHAGGEHPVADMPSIADTIVRDVGAGTYEARWMLDPSVRV